MGNLCCSTEQNADTDNQRKEQNTSTSSSTTQTKTAAVVAPEETVTPITQATKSKPPQPAASKRQPLRIIIAGAPASGKGTQCERIIQNHNIVHLSTGDMLRAAITAGTSVGTSAKEYMDAGKLVPDDVIIGILQDRLNQQDCQEMGWLLDGFPRTQAQAQALLDAGILMRPDCFLLLNVPDELLIERVVGRRTDPVTNKIYHLKFAPPPPDDEELLVRLVQRSDDTEEKVKVRLEQFHANLAAVKGCYADVCVEVDGARSPDVVAKEIDVEIRKRMHW
mmetsp:Transcript_25293/g.39178  ORF Transcript_25293/g.39178 Transcript_25293/m.39178 type:complete len:279 (-) Transcript_25293:150-986(-)|eukprot:CAMPEP_0196818790 /NCGR_PEP_ID=MMETSP1362-20130617/67553_1 /TAXON_ID=163516 /ORGANISM="Leptocylindrus danicus, Strain CCMP1856" /LENGTH=278 /DNA_ID=CAMNT_0042197043 /DNA_START=523 /DNA_END=1359 /DNA_ORIENTATION=-